MFRKGLNQEQTSKPNNLCSVDIADIGKLQKDQVDTFHYRIRIIFEEIKDYYFISFVFMMTTKYK